MRTIWDAMKTTKSTVSETCVIILKSKSAVETTTFCLVYRPNTRVTKNIGLIIWKKKIWFKVVLRLKKTRIFRIQPLKVMADETVAIDVQPPSWGGRKWDLCMKNMQCGGTDVRTMLRMFVAQHGRRGKFQPWAPQMTLNEIQKKLLTAWNRQSGRQTRRRHDHETGDKFSKTVRVRRDEWNGSGLDSAGALVCQDVRTRTAKYILQSHVETGEIARIFRRSTNRIIDA